MTEVWLVEQTFDYEEGGGVSGVYSSREKAVDAVYREYERLVLELDSPALIRWSNSFGNVYVTRYIVE